MPGGRSIKLATVLGIRVGVDPSWFLVLFLFIWWLSGAYGDVRPGEPTTAFALATASALLFFASVVLHELGHAVVARRNGVEIAGIDLWLFGGLARMRRDTSSPGAEFRMAAAGPLVTLLIVAACAAGGVALAGPEGFERALGFGRGADGVAAVLGFLAWINAGLLVFNLVPGFPLDGGRIARAIAWKVTGDRARATRFAATLGRLFGWFLIASGAFLTFRGVLVSGIWAIFLGFFLAQAARAAEVQTAVTSRIEGLRVADVMDAEPVAVPAEAPLDRVHEDFFLRYRWPWFPVVDAERRFLGLVRSEAVEELPEPARAGRTARDALADGSGAAFRVDEEEPLEALLGSESLQRLGALMAVDRDGVLRGVVTVERVRRALRPTRPAV